MVVGTGIICDDSAAFTDSSSDPKDFRLDSF